MPSVRLALIGAAAIAAALPLSAQNAVNPPGSDAESGNETVRMDQFEVTTTQGHGYMLPNSAGAFKTSAALLDIPQIDVVITNDLLQDIGFENLTDVLNYFGAYQYFESDNAKIRGGIQTTQQYADDIPVHAGWSDPNTMDSVEIIKGGAEGLYMLNSGLGGIVMRTLKKPLPYEQNIAWAWIDQYGLYQFGFDSTGPIGKIGEVEIDYRVIADIQGGSSYFDNVTDKRKTLAPYFQAKYKNTVVRFHFDDENVVGSQTGLALLNPRGWNLYTGAGRQVSNNPPNNMNHIWSDLYEGSIIERFSDNWEMRLTGQYFRQGYFGPQVTLTGVNWALGDEYFVNRENDQRWDYWTAISDITGQYNLGPSNWEMKNTDIWGWAFTDQDTQKYIFSTTTVPFSDAAQGIPLLERAALDLLGGAVQQPGGDQRRGRPALEHLLRTEQGGGLALHDLERRILLAAYHGGHPQVAGRHPGRILDQRHFRLDCRRLRRPLAGPGAPRLAVGPPHRRGFPSHPGNFDLRLEFDEFLAAVDHLKLFCQRAAQHRAPGRQGQ